MHKHPYKENLSYISIIMCLYSNLIGKKNKGSCNFNGLKIKNFQFFNACGSKRTNKNWELSYLYFEGVTKPVNVRMYKFFFFFSLINISKDSAWPTFLSASHYYCWSLHKNHNVAVVSPWLLSHYCCQSLQCPELTGGLSLSPQRRKVNGQWSRSRLGRRKGYFCPEPG